MSSRRLRALVLVLALGATVAASGPPAASARLAYVTAANASQGGAVPVDLGSGIVGSIVPVPTEGPPPDVAIAPDGSTAYVANGFDGIVPIRVADNTAGAQIDTGTLSCPSALAVKPDGTRLYSADNCDESVSVIDTATGTQLTKITVGKSPDGISITPDGTRAYVSNGGDGTVTPIDLATNTAGTPIPVGEFPAGSAATPDGTRVYVTVGGEDAVRRIDVAGNSVGPPIAVGPSPDQIAIVPDSSRAYVVSGFQPATPIDLTADTAGAAIDAEGDFLGDVAAAPDGARAWLTAEGQAHNRLLPIEVPGNTLGAEIDGVERPHAIAIVPNQPPHAAFSSSPASVLRGDPVSFDAGGSSDPDGNVARYEWDFGDGGPPVAAGPTPQHTYDFGGTYTVTLTETDNEGCSTRIVFPGQTAQCNGSSVARVSHQVKVDPKCISVSASASSFVPKYRPASVVPGVRIRLAASAPARLTVDSTLTWRRHGGGEADLGQLVTNVEHWRRVRYVIPRKLRGKLPLGLPVSVKLRIEAAPLDESLCPGQVVEKTLNVRIVKVIPGAVQNGRRK